MKPHGNGERESKETEITGKKRNALTGVERRMDLAKHCPRENHRAKKRNKSNKKKEGSRNEITRNRKYNADTEEEGK